MAVIVLVNVRHLGNVFVNVGESLLFGFSLGLDVNDLLLDV